MMKRCEMGRIGIFSALPVCLQPAARSRYNDGLCHSACADLLSTGCGFGRVGTNRYRGIGIHCTPCHEGAESESRIQESLAQLNYCRFALQSPRMTKVQSDGAHGREFQKRASLPSRSGRVVF
jgi:hypothetical protein